MKIGGFPLAGRAGDQAADLDQQVGVLRSHYTWRLQMMDHDWQFGERFEQRWSKPRTHIQREAPPGQFAETLRQLACEPIADAAELGMPLILVQDLADARIGRGRPSRRRRG